MPKNSDTVSDTLRQGRRHSIARLGAFLVWAAAGSDAYAERLRVYESENFHGNNMLYMDAIPNLQTTESSGAIASLRVITGRWLLCAGPNYAGDCVWAAHDLSSLPNIRFTTKIGSLRPQRVPTLLRQWGEKSPPPRRALVLFSKSNYEGNWSPVFDSISDFGSDHIAATTGSVVLNTGVWRLCTQPRFSGRCITLNGSAWDLGDIFVTQVRSAERIK